MHNYTSFLLQKQGISSKNKDFFRKRFRCFRRVAGRLVLFSDASVSHHRDKRPIVFCTYLTNSFLARRPCWTNPPKCQPPLFRPADSVHNTRTFVFVRAGWTAAEVIGNIFHEYSVYFQHSSNISTLQGRFDQMIRRGVSTKGGKKAAAPAGAAADIHFTWRPWDQTAVMLWRWSI